MIEGVSGARRADGRGAGHGAGGRGARAAAHWHRSWFLSRSAVCARSFLRMSVRRRVWRCGVCGTHNTYQLYTLETRIALHKHSRQSSCARWDRRSRGPAGPCAMVMARGSWRRRGPRDRKTSLSRVLFCAVVDITMARVPCLYAVCGRGRAARRLRSRYSSTGDTSRSEYSSTVGTSYRRAGRCRLPVWASARKP